MNKQIFILVLLMIFSSGCSSQRGVIISPNGHSLLWEESAPGKTVEIKNLGKTNEISTHIVRLHTAEVPHIHNKHDLTVFVIKGKAKIHLANQVRMTQLGDVIEIPRGTPHWAENIDSNPSEVYVVFSPPFDGKDKEVVEPF